ncbi:response regulator transcription factor [Coriobacteriaceae bacterium]|uniref:Transcriptional regulatory protein DltR n=1 Tax=Granulimonas faecalis TaxID=2894155 RepID=A0AAV5B441_9ACTN|nr:response regulator transcription factor [Granulimonas faecalis]MBF0598593.1 response regulator transcription factor [Atopobiaceae bacterium FL090493]TGY60680.1 response regulator transcription factor [Coriobacteriaceae bacterium]GJM55398.1 transcriptional regulatory protein DltR [Granulimonas faecalis]
MNILVVEDEKNLNDAMCHVLTEDGCHAKAAYDGKAGYELAKTGEYDVVVLDVMLPEMDGFEVVHQLRRDGVATPVIIVTAKTSTTDKIEGLDCGADDYMTKPIDTDELLARIRALSRRKGEVPIDEMKFGDLALDLHTHDLRCNGRDVHLSQKEFEVMRMLMSSTGRVVSKHDLLASIWGTEGDTSENSAEAYISFLRKKLSHLHSEVQITTLRMLGYRLEELG